MARYHLALMPDRGDGNPDYGMNPIPLKLLPEGTGKLVIEAYWHVDGTDRTFTGGVESFEVDLSKEIDSTWQQM